MDFEQLNNSIIDCLIKPIPHRVRELNIPISEKNKDEYYYFKSSKQRPLLTGKALSIINEMEPNIKLLHLTRVYLNAELLFISTG